MAASCYVHNLHSGQNPQCNRHSVSMGPKSKRPAPFKHLVHFHGFNPCVLLDVITPASVKRITHQRDTSTFPASCSETSSCYILNHFRHRMKLYNLCLSTLCILLSSSSSLSKSFTSSAIPLTSATSSSLPETSSSSSATCWFTTCRMCLVKPLSSLWLPQLSPPFPVP